MATITTTNLSSLVVSLALVFLFIQTSHAVPIYFQSVFENGSSPFNLRCISPDGELVIKNRPISPGVTLTFWGDKNVMQYQCAANWEDKYIARFDGWMKHRDSGHHRLYWKADKTSWYLSYDNSTFMKIVDWSIGV